MKRSKIKYEEPGELFEGNGLPDDKIVINKKYVDITFDESLNFYSFDNCVFEKCVFLGYF